MCCPSAEEGAAGRAPWKASDLAGEGTTRPLGPGETPRLSQTGAGLELLG